MKATTRMVTFARLIGLYGGACPFASCQEWVPCEGSWDFDEGGSSDVLAVRAGLDHTCALRATGNVVCWGAAGFGQLGDGEEYGEDAPQPSLVQVLGIDDAIQIAVGDRHACALQGSGEVVCWGRNDQGQLGDGTTDDRSIPVVVRVRDVTAALEIGAGVTSLGGSYYDRIGSCALLPAGHELLCWGNSELTGAGRVAVEPYVIDRGIEHFSMGSSGLCHVDGTGLTDCNFEYWSAQDLEEIEQTSVGAGDACLRRVGGTIACWTNGELADVDGITDAVDVGVGGFICAVTSSGGVLCWGGLSGTWPPDPTVVEGLTDATQVTVGRSHACAVRSTGAVVCWGANLAGQRGNGSACEYGDWDNRLTDVNGLH